MYDNVQFAVFLCAICFVAKFISLLLYIGSKVAIVRNIENNNGDMFENSNLKYEK